MSLGRNERSTGTVEAFVSGFEALRSTIWTSLPCIIQSFNESNMTVNCVPAIQGVVTDINGVDQSVTLPTLLDCPVVFSGGGGFGMYFRPSVGDEAIVLFSARCIDAWWQSGGIQQQAELRMHDLSDGMVIVGLRSIPRVIPINSALEIKDDAGNTIISMDDGLIKIKATNIEIEGDVLVKGNIEQEVGYGLISNGVPYATHRHTGVDAGGDISGEIV